ncbi:MAG: ACT domain-containing protein [Methylacidiphilales bacterium]|nr:ACT domain-containing protein [Candidatus Methylacidiphilales bacterium]MDW8349522.1 ACT domain-containing protein [Verrucomicrobiae bacterium]
MRASLTSQLAIFLSNNPGTLAAICDVLAKHDINILAIATSDAVDYAVDRLVVDKPKTALRLFEERGALVIETPVLLVEGINRPGSLSRLAHALSDAGVNIEYLYCATPANELHGALILKASDAGLALKVINQLPD